MPRFNGSGPAGQGPLTGRGMGPCNERYVDASPRAGFGRGLGAGRGMGARARGFAGGGRGFAPARAMAYERGMGYSSDISQRDMLENEKRYLEEELEEIKGLLKDQKDE